MKRRTLLFSLAAGGGVLAFAALSPASEETGAEKFEFMLSDAEWRKRLSEDAYAVLRHEATERPYTSTLLNEKRAGTYTCAGCDLPLYSSRAKFNSGTGWPSFYEALPNAIGTKTDYKLLMSRVRCIAVAAAAISVICSTTVRRRPASVTASTVSRWGFALQTLPNRDPGRTGQSLSASTSIGTPKARFDVRMPSADLTTLTFGAGVRLVVRNF